MLSGVNTRATARATATACATINDTGECAVIVMNSTVSQQHYFDEYYSACCQSSCCECCLLLTHSIQCSAVRCNITTQQDNMTTLGDQISSLMQGLGAGESPQRVLLTVIP
jgi:hypothetical protein